MITQGIKFTHDAAIATFDENTLVECIEAEKINNNPRHSKFRSWGEVSKFYQLDADVVIDGWKEGRPARHFDQDLLGASYFDWDNEDRGLMQSVTNFGRAGPTYSYTHVRNHITSAIMMSDFPPEEAVGAMVWDGGMPLRYFEASPNLGNIRAKDVVLWLEGTIYSIMGYYWGPFADPRFKNAFAVPHPEERLLGGYSVPGKLMSWIGFGKETPDSLCDLIEECYEGALRIFPRNEHQGYHNTGSLEHQFCLNVKKYCFGYDDATILRAIHTWIETCIRTFVLDIEQETPLVFVGGSALNIKWNSAIREVHPRFFVPPVPNDCGSAIGAACTHLSTLGHNRVNWDVFSGPNLVENGGWAPTSRSAVDILRNGEVLIRLQGRAEIGPRALGHRSLLGRADMAGMKGKMNHVKGRETWRPVAPICTPKAAWEYFGAESDPYMLFDHKIKHPEAFPAVSHLDGTARVQTISREADPELFELLTAFDGVLCNTSANYRGSGFFPSTGDAANWAEANGVSYALINGKVMQLDE